jgi:hypothetical protein
MGSRFRSLQLYVPLAFVLLLAGCAGTPDGKADVMPTVEYMRELREKEMVMTWAGQPYHDLVQVFGEPQMVMSLPSSRPWKASVVVYEGLDPASNCIDAFTVMHGEKAVVDDYFCR